MQLKTVLKCNNLKLPLRLVDNPVHPGIDHRRLNDITAKNRYPLSNLRCF